MSPEREAKWKAAGERMAQSVGRLLNRTIAPINTRLSTLETRTGALSMLAARGHSAESIAAFEALEARIKALELAVQSRREPE